MDIIIVILILSLILQILNIFFAFRLVKTSGFQLVWWLISLAIFFRLIRNGLFLADLWVQPVIIGRMAEEISGLLISILLLIAVIKMQPIFLYYKKNIDELNETKENFLTIFRDSQDGIAVLQEGRIKLVNPKIISMTGYAEKEIIGKEFLGFLDYNYREMIAEKYKSRLSGKIRPTDQYEASILQKDGNSLPVEVTVSLINFSKQPATLVVVRDISVRKEAESDILNMGDDLVKINQALIGRELKMVELKKEIEVLKSKIK